MARAVNLPITDAARNMTLSVKVTGVRRYRARLWLGGQIIRFAARVIGMRGAVEIILDRGDE
jgi:hypothetical protein